MASRRCQAPEGDGQSVSELGTSPEARKISIITRSERAASGFGKKKVIGCNGEVRDGASLGFMVIAGDTASCLILVLVSSVK
jgi:hypothetical protein